MARPLKIGLDYFNFDVDFFQNKKVRRLKLACGAQSITVLLNLLCNIYRDKGYYIEWDEDLPFLVADEIGISEGAALEAIKKAVQVKFFNPALAEKGILTSKEIQARYAKVCKDAKRTNWEISEEWNLLEVVNEVSTGKTTEETKLPPPKSTQRREENSKLDKNREINTDSRAITFLKKNYASRFQTEFQMRYANKIKNKVKFAEDFNDTVDQEGLEYSDKKLFARLGKYARNWIENQDKYSKTEQKPASAPERF